MWDAKSYFENLTGKLKLTKGKYLFCQVTGLDYMEGVLAAHASAKAYIAVDDTDEGMTFQGSGGGFFIRRAVVVFILKKYDIKSQPDRTEKVNETRVVHSKFLARIIKDTRLVPELKFLDKSRIPFHEVPGYFVAGTCGIYFTLSIDEPIDLVYDVNDWDE